MKNKAMFIKKSISVLLAIVMLVSAFSVMSVTAAGTTGYYKTIASENYEKANPVTQTDGFSVVTTLNNGSMGYLFSNPKTTFPVGADIPLTGIEQNKTYTYELDFYVTKYSNDANGCLIAPFVSGNNGYESQAWLGKDKYSLNQWYTYSTTFTATKSYTNFKTTIHTYGEAAIIYDNLRISDENGNVVFSEDFETEKYNLPESFSYINDYSSGGTDGNDKVLHITNRTNAQVQTTIGTTGIGVNGATTQYELSFDYMILNRSSNPKFDFSFQLGNYCENCKGAIDSHKFKGDTEYYLGSNASKGVWYTAKGNVTISANCTNVYGLLYVSAGAEILLDNIKYTDKNGNVVTEFNMDNGTLSGDIFSANKPLNGAEIITKNQLLWVNGTPNVADGHLYVDATKLIAENKDVPVDFTISENITSTEYPYVNFKYRLLEGTTLKSGTMLAIALDGYDEGTVQWFPIPEQYNVGEWIEVKEKNFGNVSYTAGDVRMNIHVYSGVEIEIDDIEIHRNQNSGGVILANVNFADNGRFTEESDVELVNNQKDYAVLVDNSANSGNGQLYPHELGMPYDGKTYPAGSYTFSFDFYTVSIGGSNIFPMQFTKPDWNGDCMPQKWVTLSGNTGVWETVTFDVTTNTDGKFPWFYVGAGIKGYFDNFKIVDKSNGKTLLEVPFTEADLGKTSKTINTVVELPADIANAKDGGGSGSEPEKSGDYAVLVDNSANSGNGQLYPHELGMPYDGKTYPAGNYTFSFDFYTVSIGESNIFPMQFTKPDWNGDCMPQKWVTLSGNTGVWETVTFDVTTNTDGKFPWFYVGAGIKGYFDNFKIVDKSNGKTLLEVPFTKDDLGKTSKNINTVVELPETLFENDTVTTVEGDNYTVSFIKDNEGMKTYGSNGVLKIAPLENKYYGINNTNFGVNFVTGNKYRISFDYMVTVPAAQNFYFAVTNINGKGNHDFINYEDALIGTVSYEFTYAESLDLVIYGGGEVVFDNFFIEEYVEVSSSNVVPAQLQTIKRMSGAETYIDVIVNSSISSTNFTFNINYDINHVQYIQTSASEVSANVVGKTNGSDNIAVTVNSTEKTWWGSIKAVNGKIAVLTFLVREGENTDIAFTLSNFNGLNMEDAVSNVSINTVISSLGLLKREPTEEGCILSFGMNIRKKDGVEYVLNENHDSTQIATKGFLVVKSKHLNGELSLNGEYNPFVKNVVVETAENEYDTHNVYTLAVTAIPEDVIIAARSYIIDANGNAYYSDLITGSVNDLKNNDYDKWLVSEIGVSATTFAISSKVAQTWQGANAISQGFIYTNGYTDEQIATELDRIDDMDIQMVRSYYDQSFSAYYDSNSNSVKYNWNTEEMQGLVKWIKAMQERNVEVALNMCWALGDVWNNHCTTYTYDDCDAACRAGGIATSDNPFWCLRKADSGSTGRAIDAYGDWVAASLDYLVNDCGLTNVKYLIMFTEPTQDYTSNGSFTGHWTDYHKLVKSANDALVAANLRDKFEMVGPNLGFTYDKNTSYIDKMDTFFDDGAAYDITDCIDIYSFHLYAPSWPDEGTYYDNPKENNYDRYKEHFEQFIATVNKYDTGSDYWLDEWNYSGMFIDSEYYATQLAQAVVAALNSGVENVMLWQLFETKWPDRNDTGGEFVNGTHAMGLAPSLMESDIPYDVYYGYTLLTKYMGKRGATVYQGNGYDGIYSAMIENTDGTQSILIVNTNTTEKIINLTVGVEVNGTLFRHMYNPATVNPTAKAEIIKADKIFTDITSGLVDTLPGGAIAVYTTALSNIS